MDVKSINVPDLQRDLDNNDIFVYASYLKPGYHKLLIYDPELNRAYCQDFVLNLNMREDIFPEFPIIESVIMEVRIPWIWRKWGEDTQD